MTKSEKKQSMEIASATVEALDLCLCEVACDYMMHDQKVSIPRNWNDLVFDGYFEITDVE